MKAVESDYPSLIGGEMIVGQVWLLALLLSQTGGHSIGNKKGWTPQYGTVSNPNHPSMKPRVDHGDIYKIDNQLYRSKSGGECSEMISSVGLPSSGDRRHPYWEMVAEGTYMYPKSIGDDLEIGHFYRSTEGQLYQVMDQSKALILLDEKESWMTLLRSEIGDKRIGDILIPGTHDSGTVGVTEKSFLVDRNELFIFAEGFEPKIIANWSKTQESSIGEQLKAGFRNLDMRIADLEDADGSLRWWHGMTGHEIQIELQEIADFARKHPHEVIKLDFHRFAKPGDKNSPLLPIPDRRKDTIAEILLKYLEPYLASQSQLSSNPTINEVLATGKNIILQMNDAYIRRKHDGFWSLISTTRWVASTNPEELFAERSRKQETYLAFNSDDYTQISGCLTADTNTIVAGLLKLYGDNKIIMRLIRKLAPEYADVKPENLSFEGMWYDIIGYTRHGLNNRGMQARPKDLYTSGGSVQYRGVNDMVRYWAARPGKYKVNEVHVDDAVGSSNIVDTAISYAKGEIKREVAITYQGNAKDGYYHWGPNRLSTIGGGEGLLCDEAVKVRYRVTSNMYAINEEWVDIASKGEVTFYEGQYPLDTEVILEAQGTSTNGAWVIIYTHNVLDLIDMTQDLYLRAADTGENGFAYVSDRYNLFGEKCDLPPENGYIKLVEW